MWGAAFGWKYDITFGRETCGATRNFWLEGKPQKTFMKT